MKSVLLKITSHDFITLLKDRPYAFFLLSVVFSQIAFNMMNVVLIFLVFNLTSSNFLVSMILLISLLPQVFLSFLGGIVADSRSKKKILVLGNIGRALFIFPLFFLNQSLLAVYFLALLISIVTQFYVPAETPLIPKLVPEKLLIPANSLFGLALFGSVLLGYIFAGPAILALGNANVFLILSVLFICAGVFANLIPKKVLKVHVENTPKTKVNAVLLKESFRSYLVATYRLLRETTGVTLSFIFLIVSQVVVTILAIIIPGYAKDILHIKVENVSLLLFAPAALGMIISAFFVGTVFKNSNRNKLMDTGIFLSAAVLLLLPLMSRVTSREFIVTINSFLPKIMQIDVLHMVVILAFLAGFGNALVFIPSQATIQEKIPENFRSKMYGLLFALIGVFSLLPIILVGGLADTIGVNFVLTLVGGLILMGGVLQIVILKIVKKR